MSDQQQSNIKNINSFREDIYEFNKEENNLLENFSKIKKENNIFGNQYNNLKNIKNKYKTGTYLDYDYLIPIANKYSHKGIKAIDFVSNNEENKKVYAPFTGKIVKIYSKNNSIWFQSLEKVKFSNGIVDYATVRLVHSNNIKDLMKANEIILKIFDNILMDKMSDIENEKTELLNMDINSLLSNFSKEKTPLINIDKLEEYQIYSNLKRGNKFFPYVIEFHIIIYHVHNLLEFKKNKDKNEIFLKNIFECYFLLNDNNKFQKYEADLFKPECTISSSIEKDYITIKYKSPLFLTNIRNPRNGINEFLFILDFKDKSSYSCNNIRNIIFSIDI
jgi:hypothetical protein